MNQNKSFIIMNIAVVCFGMAGLFAKWIELPASIITFGRVFFSSISLFFYCLLMKHNTKIKNRYHLCVFIGAGAILAIHWWSFLYAIQISSIAIGTIAFSTFPLFITFLEPFFFHQKHQCKDILFCLMILLGVFMTIPSFTLENQVFQGIIIGIISALSYAILTLINRYFSYLYSSLTISLYEQSSAAVILLPTVLVLKVVPSLKDLGLLVFLGVITTALAHTLFISCLKQVPAHIAGMISSMETVYSILLAMMIFQEIPSLREIIGAFIITSVVIISQYHEKENYSES